MARPQTLTHEEQSIYNCTMAFLDVLDAINVFGYFAAFWLFIFRAEFRRSCLTAWSQASPGRRFLLGVEALVSFICGVGPFAFAWWLLAR